MQSSQFNEYHYSRQRFRSLTYPPLLKLEENNAWSSMNTEYPCHVSGLLLGPAYMQGLKAMWPRENHSTSLAPFVHL